MFFSNPVTNFGTYYTIPSGPTLTSFIEWLTVEISVQEYYVHFIKALVQMSNIYMELGNTGNAVRMIWTASKNMDGSLPGIDMSSLKSLVGDGKVEELTQLRHPDPQLSAKLEIQDKTLQIRGSWEKINLGQAARMGPRMGFASFVWNGTIKIVLQPHSLYQ